MDGLGSLMLMLPVPSPKKVGGLSDQISNLHGVKCDNARLGTRHIQRKSTRQRTRTKTIYDKKIVAQ